MKTDQNSFDVKYDCGSDVLYISTRIDSASRGIEDEYGFVWRYRDDELIGVTVIDFKDYWTFHIPILAGEISNRFHFPLSQVELVLHRALKA